MEALALPFQNQLTDRGADQEETLDYLAKALFVRNSTDAEIVCITACVVVGKGAEESWRRAYRPVPEKWPEPVHMQRATDLKAVVFSNLFEKLAGGAELELGRRAVRVHLQDAKLALQVAKEVLEKFLAVPPYFFQVLSCDHAAGSKTSVAHDMIFASLPFGPCFKEGAGRYSLELVCRSLYAPKHFPMIPLCQETFAPYDVEGMHEQPGWRGRILVLAEMDHPDIHKLGRFVLHGMARFHKRPFWEVLFGFGRYSLPVELIGPEAFALRAQERQQAVGPQPQPPPQQQAPVVGAAAVAGAPSRDARWSLFLERLGHPLQGEAWVKLASALKELERDGHNVDPSQAKRYISGRRSMRWSTSSGHAPAEGREWKHLVAAGRSKGRGAGSGEGPLMVKKSFLKSVWMQKFSR